MDIKKINLKNYKLLRNSIAGLVIKGINVLLLFATNIFVARQLGEAVFSQFSLMLTFISIGLVVFQLGFPNFIIRSEHDSADLLGVQSQSYHVYLVGIFLSTLLLAVLITVMYFDVLFFNFIKYDPAVVLKLIGISYLGACILLTNSYLRSKGQSLVTITTDQLIVPLLVLLGIGITWFFSSMVLNNIFSVYLAMNAFGVILLVCWLYRSGIVEKVGREKLRNAVKKYNVYCSMFVFSLCFILLNHIPILILADSSHADSIAIFRVGYLMALPLLLIAYPLNILVAPYISKAYKNNEYSALNEQMRLVVKLISVLGALYLFGMVAFSEYVLIEIFKFESEGFRKLVFVILLNNYLAVIFGPVGLVLNIIEKEKYVLVVLCVAVFLSSFAMMLLVNQVGVLGLACVSVVTTLSWKLLLLHKVKHEIGVDCSVMSKKGII